MSLPSYLQQIHKLNQSIRNRDKFIEDLHQELEGYHIQDQEARGWEFMAMIFDVVDGEREESFEAKKEALGPTQNNGQSNSQVRGGTIKNSALPTQGGKNEKSNDGEVGDFCLSTSNPSDTKRPEDSDILQDTTKQSRNTAVDPSKDLQTFLEGAMDLDHIEDIKFTLMCLAQITSSFIPSSRECFVEKLVRTASLSLQAMGQIAGLGRDDNEGRHLERALIREKGKVNAMAESAIERMLKLVNKIIEDGSSSPVLGIDLAKPSEGVQKGAGQLLELVECES
ncbi:hypothetical protein BJ875DRAFT_446006 [Amylocarpus encephaloides]|uniref:Uncharacterized protein n=1 Tax=Amylocarpus encephaloides TaxID=45428 RepID=A0A9P7Y8N3_9HELO|nr:hypothetical protein BJ875DRAFT_446006 [Amylocarpus encephaloides]